MKKFLLALALMVMTLPSFDVLAEGSVAEIWKYTTNDLNADWDKNAPSWSTPAAIKAASCARFATAADGKVYTVNMKTMSIACITADGWEDLYALPDPHIDGDYYGTAISIDQAGNFLVGHYFTDVVKSSTVWSIYNPAKGEIERFELDVPADYSATVGGATFSGVGRIDCVGRVLGDLTGDAVFFIGPAFDRTAPFVRIVKISHGSDGKLKVDATHSPAVSHNVASSSLTIAQPKDNSYADYAARQNNWSGFYMYVNGGGGVNDFVSFDEDGQFDTSLFNNADLKSVVTASTSGFDTFEIGGMRYFVVNYLRSVNPSNCNTMNIAVVKEDGSIVAEWENPDYVSQYGYSSVIAEPLADGTANIYVYNSTNADGGNNRKACSAAAMLNFDPDKAVEDQPSTPGGSTAANPIIISSAQDLVDLRNKLGDGDNYIALDNDIDLAGISWKILCAYGTKSKIHLDGRNHVIRNLRPDKEQDGSLIGYFTGSVKNLGLEDVYISNTWYCTGAIAGYANNATIENCYVSGMINGAASGAFVGCNNGPLSISDCYSYADTKDSTGASQFSAGFVGRCDGDLTVSNCYAGCSVTSSAGSAAGIVVIRNSHNVTLRNVIAWNISVEGVTASPIYTSVVAGVTPVMENVMYWNGMEINGSPVTGGVSEADIRKEIISWDAFNEGKVDMVHEYPVLNWQDSFVTADIEDIIADEDAGDDEPTYYNLQGVVVKHPAHGVYIVRRGSKVTKEYIN